MSWLALLQQLTKERELCEKVVAEEDRDRLAIVVDERSCLAHLKRKIQTVLRTGIDSSDEDDDARLSRQKAKGELDVATSSLLSKYKLVAERRQMGWDAYEARSRCLRREYEETNDPTLLDQLEALPKPGVKKQKQSTPARHSVLEQPVALLVEAPMEPPPEARIVPPAALESASPPVMEVEIPADQKAAFRDEGFSRASIVMEERSARTLLQKQWRISLIEGDEELRAKQWNRECYQRELEQRQCHRDAIDSARQKRDFEEVANRYRAAASEQTNRVFLKRYLREKRVAIQSDETLERATLENEWSKWFEISIVLANFGTIMKKVLPNEEIQGRARVVTMERRWLALFLVQWSRYLRRFAILEAEFEQEMVLCFESDASIVRREIEVLENERRAQERELKRRDILRKAEEAEARERLKLEMIYGASPLTTRPGSGTGSNRLVLRPIDHLEIVKALYPASSLREYVQNASRANQENNAVFMALDQRYIKRDKIAKLNEGATAAVSYNAEKPQRHAAFVDAPAADEPSARVSPVEASIHSGVQQDSDARPPLASILKSSHDDEVQRLIHTQGGPNSSGVESVNDATHEQRSPVFV